MSEDILIEQVKRKCRASQRELYDLYAGRLLSVAMRYIGQKDIAEDILHDAFIKIFSSIDRFNYRGEGSTRAWMERITINTALEWLRRERRVNLVSLNDDYMVMKIDSADPLNEDVERVPNDVILKYISELSDGYRTVFNLYTIDGYSHREIAQELGINEKSSSSQLLRARRILATKINEYIINNG
ncbi:MAG: RNA polymerase sigma factor [Rikenellaceae bacterium]